MRYITSERDQKDVCGDIRKASFYCLFLCNKLPYA